MTFHQENALDRPLREVLEVMQQRIMTRSRYFGIPTLKSPADFWVYQELLHELRPDVVIEIGNYHGGSALALAHLCDALGHGRIVGVDIDHGAIDGQVRAHPRITLIEGDACERFEQVAGLLSPGDSVLLIEDSAHTFDNTLRIMETYGRLIPVGGYLIVEDGICHHGLAVGPSPGPFEAVEAFLERHPEFVADRDRESFLITWNPKGYLKRIRD